MEADAFDLAGCCIGVVERSRVIDGSAVRAGDAIVGLAASGLHANGYSLVRGLVAHWDLDLAEPYQARLRRTLGDAETDEALAAAPHESMATLGEVLLTPTRIYARAVLATRAAAVAAGLDLHGLAHITGGGLPGNVPRALPDGLAARLDPTRWRMPSVMRLFGALGGLDDDELRATFNGGLGMVARAARGGRPRRDRRVRGARRGGHGRRRGRRGRRPWRMHGTWKGPWSRARDRRRSRGVTTGGSPSACPAPAPTCGRSMPRRRAASSAGEIVLVFADRACPALDWAAEQGIDTALVPGGDDATLAEALAGARPDVVVLAGYMRIVGPAVLAAFPGRIVNTHPSLLPAFPGAHAVRDALAHGVAVTGVHGPPRRRDARRRPDRRPGGRPGPPGRRRGRPARRGSRPSSTGCCHGSSRCCSRRRSRWTTDGRHVTVDLERADARLPATASGAAVGVGQDRPGRPRAWARGARASSSSRPAAPPGRCARPGCR